TKKGHLLRCPFFLLYTHIGKKTSSWRRSRPRYSHFKSIDYCSLNLIYWIIKGASMKKGSKRYILCLVMISFLKSQGTERALSVSSSSSFGIPTLESVHSSDTTLSEIPTPETTNLHVELRAWWHILRTYENLAR